ncbi:MAG TPA: hypothetical protein VII78_06125, partial [Myxococcota bacterium]
MSAAPLAGRLPRSALAQTLRVLGVLHGSLLVLGETLRSWRQGRPLAFVLDDFLIGGFVIGAALAFRADDLRRRARRAARACTGNAAHALHGGADSRGLAAGFQRRDAHP